jgi:hypothetical protein
VRRAVQRAPVRAGAGSLARAVATACRLLAASERASLVVVSDGSEPFAPCEGAELEAILVGTARPNLGVTALSTAVAPAEPQKAAAFVEVMNAAASRAHAELRVDLDGSLIHVADLDLAPGERAHRVVGGISLAGEGRLVARLARVRFDDGGKDALPDDDAAYHVVRRRAVIPVDLVGESPAVALALEANPRFAVSRRAAVATGSGAVTVISGPWPKLSPGRYLLTDPSGPSSADGPVALGASVVGPRVTEWREAHPVLRRVVLSDVLVGSAISVTLPAGAVPLIGSVETPLAFALDDGERRVVGLNFDLESSNLPLRVGFPVLLYNAVEWLAGAQAQDGDGDGDELDEARAREAAGDPAAPGFYAARPGGAAVAVSVSDAGETAIAPRADVAAASAARAGRARDVEPTAWLVLLALALVLVEWFTYHRRVTV